MQSRLLVVLPSQPNVEKSQLHGAVAVLTLDHRLHSTAKTLLVINPQCLSTTRVYRGPYHANTIHSNGCPLRSSIALWHHSRRTLLPPPTSTSAIPALTRSNAQFFGITGAGLSKIRNIQNGGKRARHSVDQWDRQSAQFTSSATPQCFGNADSDSK
jgi:hypothetical protein